MQNYFPQEYEHGDISSLCSSQLQSPELQFQQTLPFGDFCCKTPVKGHTIDFKKIGDLCNRGAELG